MKATSHQQKPAAIPETEPDEIDKQMITESAAINDDTAVPLEEFMNDLEGYSGRILIRIPKSLHHQLAQDAKREGISLNQYVLYKLSRNL